MPEKYQDEIEEILRRAGEVSRSEPSKEQEKAPEDKPARLRRTSSPSRSSGPATSRRWPSVSPGKLMLAGLIVLLVGFFTFWALIWVGLGMLVVAYLLFFVSPRSMSSYEKRWRGRPVEERRTAWQKLKRWLGS